MLAPLLQSGTATAASPRTKFLHNKKETAGERGATATEYIRNARGGSPATRQRLPSAIRLFDTPQNTTAIPVRYYSTIQVGIVERSAARLFPFEGGYNNKTVRSDRPCILNFSRLMQNNSKDTHVKCEEWTWSTRRSIPCVFDCGERK